MEMVMVFLSVFVETSKGDTDYHLWCLMVLLLSWRRVSTSEEKRQWEYGKTFQARDGRKSLLLGDLNHKNPEKWFFYKEFVWIHKNLCIPPHGNTRHKGGRWETFLFLTSNDISTRQDPTVSLPMCLGELFRPISLGQMSFTPVSPRRMSAENPVQSSILENRLIEWE